MKKVLFNLVVLILISGEAFAQSKNKADNLKPYFLVILKKGPHRDQDVTRTDHGLGGGAARGEVGIEISGGAVCDRPAFSASGRLRVIY